MEIMPIPAGHTGFGPTGLSLLQQTTELIEEVVSFRPMIQDSAPTNDPGIISECRSAR